MNNGHFNIISPSCSQKLSGYSALELVLSIKTLVTFSDQRMTFPLGILMATASRFFPKLAVLHRPAIRGTSGLMIPNWLQPQWAEP